jgi:hypothetical protein
MRRLLLIPALLLTACEPEPDPIPLAVNAECEGLTPLHCSLPWPSSRWLAEDASTPTGYRLQYDPAGLPLNKDGELFVVEPYAERDGYSPGSQILTVFPSTVDLAAMPNAPIEGQWDKSLAADSPSIVVDLTTGERIAHMIEVDRRAQEDDSPSQLVPSLTLVYIRPAQRLQENHRYAVALRDVVLEGGFDAEATPAFAALRDGTVTTSAEIEARREGFETMFEGLEAAGVPREGLVQAWWFHTASEENLHDTLLAMRDDAMERVPVGGGTCTVETVQTDYDDRSWARIDGTYSVPLYVDSDRTGARLVRGADGMPEFQGWAEAPFTLLVPRSLVEPGADAGRLLAFGHGLMGSGSGEGGGGFLRGFGNDYEMVTVATDWWGMCDRDLVTVGRALSDVGEFAATGERLMQGIINQLVLTRSFKGACKDLPELQHEGHSVIDDGDPYWLGISQGGIFGGTVMALSQDTTKGALLVGGVNYPVMIGRSVDFEEYELVYKAWYDRRIDRELLMNVMSSLWDWTDPGAWLHRTVHDPLPNTPAKQILYQIARDDAQVPNLSSDMAVRALGIPLMSPSIVTPWGIETTTEPVPSAYVYYDMLVEPLPEGNQVAEDDNGSHGQQRYVDAAREQMHRFWQPDGMVENFCDTDGCNPE